MRVLLTACAVLTLAATSFAEMTNATGDRPNIFTGHVLTATPGTAGGAILYCPSEADDPAYRDAIALATGATVDYFDTRAATPDVALLSNYDLVYTWANFAYLDNVAFGDNLAAYVDAGGRVVLGAFCTYTSGNSLSGTIMTVGYCPVVSPAGNNHFALSPYVGDGTTCIHDSLTLITNYDCTFRDFLVLQGAGIQDGSYMDGEIAHAYRPDNAVVYSNGAGAIQLGCPGQWSDLISNIAKCTLPCCTRPDTLNIASDCGSGDITLTWNNTDTYDSITIRRNGVDLATLAATATSYTDVGVASGSYTYSVVAECSCGPDTVAVSGSVTHCIDTLLLDWASQTNTARQALDNLGIAYQLTTDTTAFEAQLANPWSLVVVDNPSNGLSAGASALLADYIANDGRAILSYWNLDVDPTLQAAFGVSGTIDFFAPMQVFAWDGAHPVWNNPHPLTGLTVMADSWADDGDRMTVAVDATAIGGFTMTETAGEAAVIVANNDRTIVNGFTMDQMDTATSVMLWENEITFIQGGGGPTDPGFLRGDLNSDGGFDISDAVFGLSALFVPGSPVPGCLETADVNSDGTFDISDMVFALSALFVPGSPTPAAPFPACAPNPAPLGCATPQC